MVMVEALACGTPVIAFPEGAAREIVIDGHNGLHAADEQTMAEATRSIDTIDPARCRESVVCRYDASIVASGYEAVYGRAIRVAGGGVARLAARGPLRESTERPALRAARGSLLLPTG